MIFLSVGVSLNQNYFASDGLAIKIINVDVFGSPSSNEITTTITLNDTANHIGVYLVLDDVAFDGLKDGEYNVQPHWVKINDSTIAYFSSNTINQVPYDIAGAIVGDVVDYRQTVTFVSVQNHREKIQGFTISGLTNLPADDENFDASISQHISRPMSFSTGDYSFVTIEDTTFLPTSGTVTLIILLEKFEKDLLISLLLKYLAQ